MKTEAFDTDVLIIGGGNAALCAAIMAREAGSRVLLLGGEPFESPILLWWNFVGRTQEELRIAREQWADHDPRFGEVAGYEGPRLEAPAFPDKMRASR